jgi:hypothetical protein
VNRAACQAAPRVREAQNLRISLLNSLLAGKWGTERGLLETASTTNSLPSFQFTVVSFQLRPLPPTPLIPFSLGPLVPFFLVKPPIQKYFLTPFVFSAK